MNFRGTNKNKKQEEEEKKDQQEQEKKEQSESYTMAPSKIRRALGAVKDKTSIGLAKVGSSTSLSDLEVAIVKATRHEEYPAEERHVREILSLTCYSRAYISACVNTLSRRLNKTKNWTVALKTLMLIQRLVSEGDPAYEQEIFFSTRRGTRFLNMSDFRDTSQSNSWDYSAFVRTYALYLDERLEFRMQSRRGRRSAFGLDEEDEHHHHHQQQQQHINSSSSNNNEDNNDNDNNDEEDHSKAIIVRATPMRDMTSEQIFSRTQHLQQLLERFLACRPTGSFHFNTTFVLVSFFLFYFGMFWFTLLPIFLRFILASYHFHPYLQDFNTNLYFIQKF